MDIPGRGRLGKGSGVDGLAAFQEERASDWESAHLDPGPHLATN